MIKVHTHALGDWGNLVYVIEHNGKAIFVDPAWNANTLILTAQNLNLTPAGVLLTHSHVDHVDALPDILTHYPDLPIYISKVEAEHSRFSISSKHIHYIEDDEVVSLADLDFRVIETPGHTIGSVCFYFDKHLLSGDTLFVNGIGRCDFADSDVEAMYDSLQKLKSLGLPDDTVIYSGHDYGTTPTDKLGNQYLTNPYYLIDDKAFFVKMRLELQPTLHRIPFKARTPADIIRFMEQS